MVSTYDGYKIIQGQKFTMEVSMEDENGTIVPIVETKARLTICYRDYDGEIAFTGTTENGCITIANNIVNVLITSDQTSLLKYDNAVYELELIDSFDEVIGLLRGNISILKGVI